MSRKILMVGSLIATIALAVLVLSQALSLDAQEVDNNLRVPSLVRGNAEYTFQWNGPKFQKFEISLNAGRTWRELHGPGSGDVTVMIPGGDTNEAQVRITLLGNNGKPEPIPSDLFTIDSTPPRTVIDGTPYVDRNTNSFRIPFNVIGPGVESVGLVLINSEGERIDGGRKPLDEAKRDGFAVPPDNIYSVLLHARDQVGNTEQTSSPLIRDIVVDTNSPNLLLDLNFPAGRGQYGDYVIGGETLTLTYEVRDSNPDYSSVRFEVIDKNQKVLAQIDPGSSVGQVGRIYWAVPYEDWGVARVRMTAADHAGNLTTETTGPFAVFAGTPEAFIVYEDTASNDKLKLILDFLHIAGFETVQLGLNVHIYEGRWDRDNDRFIWDKDTVYKDTEIKKEMRNGKEVDYIEISTQRQDKAYVARLVAGSGIGVGREELTESLPWPLTSFSNPETIAPDPSRETQPESIWIGVDRVRRITLIDLPPEERIVNSSEGVKLLYDVPSGSERGTQLILEYSIDGGMTWQKITPEPLTVDLSKDGDQTYVWSNPPSNIKYATVRAVTQFTSDTGDLYRVLDVMDGGLIIDGKNPSATILRVLDHKGRALADNDYTNSPELSIEWRASDEGSAGLSNLVLWDNVKTSSTTMGSSIYEWNDKKFQPGSHSPGESPRDIKPTDKNYVVKYGAVARPIGKLGFILEAVDRAGNRRFPSGGPAASSVPEFSLNIDLLPPKVKIIDRPDVSSYRPGEVIKLAWEAWDNNPDPLISQSMSANAISIHVVYGATDDGEVQRSTLVTDLPINGSTEIIVPALVDKEIQFLVTARDKAGNTSSFTDLDALTRAAPVRNVKVPRAVIETPTLSADGNSLDISWRIEQGDPDDIAEVTLWVRKDPTMPFERVQVARSGDSMNFKLPASDEDFEFAVTAKSVDGLTEPVPSIGEASYVHDVLDPEVALEIRDVTHQQEVRFYVREDEHGTEHFPHIWVRVADKHFNPNGVSIELLRSGSKGRDSISDAKVVNGQWVDLGPVPVARAENISVVLTARDTEGNQSSVTKQLEVRDPAKWEFMGLRGSAPYYTRTQRYLYWKYNGDDVSDRKVSLSIQKVKITADTGELENDGEEIPIVTDTEDDGVYYFEAGLPDVPGLYHFVLRAKDGDGNDRMARTRRPTDIKRPAIEVSVDPGIEASTRAGREEYQFKGTSSREIFINVRDNVRGMGDNASWYPLPPAEKDGLLVRYRFQGPDMAEPGPEQTQRFESLQRPASASTELTLGSYPVVFKPVFGEGRYEIFPEFKDIYGHKGVWPDDPKIGVMLVFDGGAPKVSIDALIDKKAFYTQKDIEQLFVSAEDPLLINNESKGPRLEFRTQPGGPWKEMKTAPMTERESSATSLKGMLKPIFEEAGRYEIRFVAEDELGQLGVAMLNGPVYAGKANYVASHPLPLNRDDPVYTNELYSRRPNFRIKVIPVNPWPEDVGLGQMTLWWRMVIPNSSKQDEWHPIDFKDRWLIGQLQGKDVLPEAKGHEISLPFTAERSGKYEFVVTTQSLYEQYEPPETLPAYGTRRTIPRDTEPEYSATVYVAGSSVEVQMPNEGPQMEAGQVVSLEQGRIQQHETYEVTWTYTTSIENDENIESIDFSLRFFDGVKFHDSLALTPAPENDPRIGLLSFTEESAENQKDMVGNRLKVRTYRAYWTCPPDIVDVEKFFAHLEITAHEKTRDNALPPLSYVSKSPRFKIGEPRSRDDNVQSDYYTRKMEDGQKSMQDGKYWEAIRHYRDARVEADTTEANQALAMAYRKVGDSQRSEYHKNHAVRPGVVDRIR